MSVLTEMATLVVRRATADALYPGGAEALIEWLSEDARGARWVVSDAHLVAASFKDAELGQGVDALTTAGLVLLRDRDGGGYHYEDMAVVDALFGLAEHCDWLRWERPTRKPFGICWLAGTERGDLAVPLGHTPGADVSLEEYARWVPGLVRVAVEPPTEIWLDTATGRIHRKAIQPLLSEPGPLMEPLYRRLPDEWTVSHVRLTEGDAEELHADVSCGGCRCELRIRTYEHQEHIEALLHWPIAIPQEHRPEIEARLGDIRNWEFDPVRGCPTSFILYAAEIPVREDMAQVVVGILITVMLKLQTGLEKLADEEGFTWLQPVLGLEPQQGQGTKVRRVGPVTRHALNAPMDIDKRRRLREG